MAKPRPEKKPEPAAPGTTRMLPIQLQLGDRVTDATGEWEVITRPYVSAGGKLASAHVRKIGRPETTDLRTWSAHERIAVKRGAAKCTKSATPTSASGTRGFASTASCARC